MFNTIKEAVYYAYSIYNNHYEWEVIPTAIYEKDGKYNAGTFEDYDHAIGCGWKFIGTPAQLKEKMA